MSGPSVCRSGIAVGLFVALGFSVACDEADDIVVNVDPNNEPPTIVLQGPEFSSAPIEVVGASAPTPWVLVGDTNGLDDISAVLLDVQTIRIHGLILRPVDLSSGCARLEYVPNGNIETSAWLPFPADAGQVKSVSLRHDQGGIYRVNSLSPLRLYEALPMFGRPSGCATGPPGWLDWFVLLPPAASEPTDVFLTYIDQEFIGVTVTVYDSSGASAKATFPNLRVVFTTSEEKSVAP